MIFYISAMLVVALVYVKAGTALFSSMENEGQVATVN